MSHCRFDARVLRQLADGLVDELIENDVLYESQRDDYVISLVRQWITYEGVAGLFLGERPIYLKLIQTPLGRLKVAEEPGLGGWHKVLSEDWLIDPETLPDLFDQLNRGQSAETINAEGIPLRLWVDPAKRSRGVEPLVTQQPPPGAGVDLHKIARGGLQQQFGDQWDEDEIEALAGSISRQWQKFDGHACIFLSGREQVHYRIVENDEGGGKVTVSHEAIDLDRALTNFGFPPAALTEMIADINLGKVLQIQDSTSGKRARLWHDPKERRFCIQQIDSEPPPPAP